MPDAAAAARADRLRQVRAQALAKTQQSKKVSEPEPESEQQPPAADVAAELGWQQAALADEAIRALVEEEDASTQKQKGKGGKGGKKPKPPQPSAKRQVKVSKAMSYLLRHGAADADIKMRADGYVELTALLAHKSLRGCTVAEAVSIVATNDKKRFALQTDPATGVQWIRANQGHTLQTVADSELLVEGDNTRPPPARPAATTTTRVPG